MFKIELQYDSKFLDMYIFFFLNLNLLIVNMVLYISQLPTVGILLKIYVPNKGFIARRSIYAGAHERRLI
jgi:hypothetical protein